MIIDFAPKYRFVFNPNVIKVTCENTTDPTKEVTLIGNGITLKRNCIASVCYFDLSIIFESYFNDTKFPLTYSAVYADIFYKDATITISADDETTITNEPFSLRWGAQQFDEVVSNASYNFPYWSGLPLIINSDKEHDLSIIPGITISAGVKIIPIATTVEFTHEVKLASTSIQTITYQRQLCPTDGHYMRWITSSGKIIHFMFYRNQDKQTTIEIKSGESVVQYAKSLTDSENGRLKLLNKDKQRSFSCFQSVDESIYSIVESIAYSPIVHYYVNSKWVAVTVKDATIVPQRAGMVDIELIIDLPTDYIQRR